MRSIGFSLYSPHLRAITLHALTLSSCYTVALHQLHLSFTIEVENYL